MAVARISELERKTTQSGKANAGRWLLEFERQEALRPDPLTGWNGSGDTNPQVRINFQTKEAAMAYCEKHGLQHHVVPAPPSMKIQGYADNFVVIHGIVRAELPKRARGSTACRRYQAGDRHRP